MHLTDTGSGLPNFNSTLILPLSGLEVCQSEASIRRQVAELHEVAFYMDVVFYLETRVQVLKARRLEQSFKSNDEILPVIHA
jgi:hypothetical protein